MSRHFDGEPRAYFDPPHRQFSGEVDDLIAESEALRAGRDPEGMAEGLMAGDLNTSAGAFDELRLGVTDLTDLYALSPRAVERARDGMLEVVYPTGLIAQDLDRGGVEETPPASERIVAKAPIMVEKRQPSKYWGAPEELGRNALTGFGSRSANDSGVPPQERAGEEGQV